MLTELQRIADKSDSVTSEDLRKAAAALMERQFLYADKRRDKGFYSLVIEHQDYFGKLFDAFNLDFICDPVTGYLGIVPRSRLFSCQLDTEHTLALLVLRMIYENTVLECRAIEGGQAVTDSNKVMDSYEQHTGRQRPGLMRLREILNTFSRQGLIDFDGQEDRVIQIRIRPSIRDIATSGWINHLEEYLVQQNQDENNAPAEGDSDETAH